MSDRDEGRDLHAAFGTLLADEPAAPWSVSDDVSRGRALQRRRRTRAGAGIGLAAAAVMVFGVFGPLRPPAAVVVPPAYQPPAVQGVDQAWLAALDRAFTGFNGAVVDWSRSTVTSTAGGGFALDLTMVGATTTTGGDDFTIEYAEPPGPPVARAIVTWKPAGGVGPVLATCSVPACVRSEASVSPGFTNEGGRWDTDGVQVAGTFVVDQTYDVGGMLEIASAPVDGTGDGWATLNFGGITFVLDRVGRPGESSPITGDDTVAQLLQSLGWTVDGVTVQRVPLGQPTESTWTASQPGTDDTTNTGRVTVRTWDDRSWQAAGEGVNPSSVIAGCATAGSCGDVLSDLADCGAAAGCWSSSTATTKAGYAGQPEGSYVLYRYNEVSKLAVEVVVEPLVCITCNASPMPPFLTPQEALQVSAVVQKAVESAPSPSPTVTGSDDSVTRVLEGYGFRVLSASPGRTKSGGMSNVYLLDVDKTADNPRTGFLSLASFPASGVPIGATSIEVEGANISTCTSATCQPLQSINVPCPSNACFQYWTTTTTADYVGFEPGTRLMFRSDGGDGAEAVVGFSRCDTCTGDQTSSEPILTVEQTEEVLNAFGYPVDTAADDACTAQQLKLVPAVDTTGGATGERSLAIEVYARNPKVSCVLDGVPTVGLQSEAGEGRSLVYTEGLYQQGPQRGAAVSVDGEHAAVFVVAKSRCDTSPIELVDQVNVQLPGDRTVTGVSLPPGFGLELCGGAAADTSTVWVSAFTPREGGVG